jgi:hypothetical protein
MEARRRAEPSLRVGAILPWILVGNTVWRMQASARLNRLAAKSAALSFAESPAWHQGARRLSYIAALRPDNGYAESEAVPGTRW